MTKTNLRTEYRLSALDERDAGADPIALFQRWFQDAVDAGGREPNAMSLATADAQGQPSVRIVLCKEFDAQGFVFYTNYASRKGRDLACNPLAALLFFWAPLERQVRIEGRVEAVAPELSDAYYAERPLEARLGAWASPQSEVIASREALEESLAQVRRRFTDPAGPARPEHWGGYRLRPERIEFWQGRPSRLHDRLLYTRRAGAPGHDGRAWVLERLAP